jgi:hypothetical protein
MPHEDQFTAVGPSLTGSGHPRSGFSTKASDMVYGLNVVGERCGVYGATERVTVDTSRDTPVEGIGVFGMGESYGIFGNGNPGIAGVYGQNNHGHKGVIGVTGQDGTGVVGANLRLGVGHPITTWQGTMPPPGMGGSGTGVWGISGTGDGTRGDSERGRGVAGTSINGTGVFGEGSQAGVEGGSLEGRGGVFRSQSSAQVQLEPRDVPINTPRTEAVRLSAWHVGEGMAPAQLPANGRAGDLLATTHPLPDEPENIVGTLWFCSRGSTDTHAAVWREVLMGPEFTDTGLVVGLRLLDDFTTGPDSFSVPPGTVTTRYQEGSMFGGVRSTTLQNVPISPSGTEVRLNVGSADRLNLELGAETFAKLEVIYGMREDGGHPLGINLHEGGARSIRATISPLAGTPIPPGTINFNVVIFTPVGWSQLGHNVGAGQIDFAFDEFSGPGGQDFTNVSYIDFIFQTSSSFRLEGIETVP